MATLWHLQSPQRVLSFVAQRIRRELKWVSLLAVLAGVLCPLSALGTPSRAEAPDQEAAKRKTAITFIGFRVHDDKSSTFRVDLAANAVVKRVKKGNQLVFLIENATIERRNNQNPLNAQFFDSNVLDAKLDKVKEGVTLTINLRTDSATQHRVRDHQAGATLIIDVPPPVTKKKESAQEKAQP